MIFMGLLEKAGNIQTNEKESVKKTTSAEKEVAAYDATIAKATETPKAGKKVTKIKKAKPAKTQKATKAPKVRKQRVTKVIPEGFTEVNKSRDWFRKLVDLIVNWSLFGFYILTQVTLGGASDLTYVLILSLLLPISNLIVMPFKTGRTVGQWITTTRYVNSRGNNPPFMYHLLKSSPVISYLCGAGAFVIGISAATEWNNGMIGVVTFGLLIFLLVPSNWLFKKLHHQNFGIWEYLFGGVWNARAQKGEGSTGNKLFQRLESLSDYTESRGWLEEKEDK
jgi:hypothetical protein